MFNRQQKSYYVNYNIIPFVGGAVLCGVPNKGVCFLEPVCSFRWRLGRMLVSAGIILTLSKNRIFAICYRKRPNTHCTH